MTQQGNMLRAVTNTVADPFSTETTGLPDATSPQVVVLGDRDTFELWAAPVANPINDDTVRMLAYNGSIPGPTLRVGQGSEVTIQVTNDTDLETTVHWHGLRLDNRSDGVPHGHHGGVQPAIPIGGSFTYTLRFPDPGIYWYHPHVREDYAQELGLYGNIIVVPTDPAYWPPVNRELTLVLDDILLNGKTVAPFSQSTSNRTAMGRYGNVLLVNGETAYQLEVACGEVVRFYLTNTANVRPFNVRIPGARMKLVGGDSGRVEHEQFIDEVLITPSERIVIDVLFERAGQVALEHCTPEQTSTLGTITVVEQAVEPSYAAAFSMLRSNPELVAERTHLDADLKRSPDKTLALVAMMPGMKHHGGGHATHGGDHGSHAGGHQQHQQHEGGHDGHGGGHQHHSGHQPLDIEWEDTMEAHNRMTTPATMHWKLVDRETGAENQAIDWSFTIDDRVKLRVINDPTSDHPMQHPFHIHGERFLVLSRDGVPNDNLVWKDTVLIRTGETVELLVEMSNSGNWMAHCHIAEHLEGGMMLSFRVEPAVG